MLRATGLPRDERRRIHAVGLAPVLGPDLPGVAGEWSGFDATWLCAHILGNLRHRPRRTRFRAWFPRTRRAWTCATDESWRRILALLDESA